MALKKWGFGSVEAARNFCQKNKSKKSWVHQNFQDLLCKKVP
jgi:hypothetical protein